MNQKIPVKKTSEEIKFYQDNGPKFGEILRKIANSLRTVNSTSTLNQDLIELYKDLCFSYWNSSEIKFPFAEQRNFLNEKYKYPICISPNDIVAHGRAHGPIKKGDILSVDCGIAIKFKNKYLHFDSAFTTTVAEPTKPWIDSPKKALIEIIRKQPSTTKEISVIIRDKARENNLSLVVSLVGHGIGYSLHEAPVIHNSSGQFSSARLFDGLVFCPEPIFVLESYSRSPISSVYVDENRWDIRTINKHPSTHFETMFAVIDGKITDLVKISEWNNESN